MKRFLGHAAEGFVPACLGVLLVAVAVPFVALPLAIGIGLLTTLGAFFGLRRVRASPNLRWVWRIALLAHVLFWGGLGVLDTHLDPAGPVSPATVVDWGEGLAIRVGYGEAPFELPRDAPLGGWGSTPRRVNLPVFGGFGFLGRASQEVMGSRGSDGAAAFPLFRPSDRDGPAVGARALVIHSKSAAPLAFVRLDLITSDADLAAAILERVRPLGITKETLTVSATHTHSSPGGFSRQRLSAVIGTGHYDRRCFDAIVASAVTAVEEASARARAAHVAPIRAVDRDTKGRGILARNRRVPLPTMIDDRVYGLRFVDAADRSPIAILLNYAVHPVLMRRHHGAFDRDLAGALEDALSASLPGDPGVLFVNGAVGDIGPQPTAETGAEQAATLAQRFAARIRADVLAGPTFPRLRVRAARVTRDLGTPHAVFTSGNRARFLRGPASGLVADDLGATLANLVALPANAIVWSFTVRDVRTGFAWDGTLGAIVNLGHVIQQRTYAFGAMVLEMSEGTGARPERMALLWTPGEATQALGKDWRQRAAARGYPNCMLFGLTNGSCAYLTTPTEYLEESYESRATLFGLGSGALAGEALEAALAAAAER